MEATAVNKLLMAPHDGQTTSKGKPVWEVIFSDGSLRQFSAKDLHELQGKIWFDQSTPRRRTGPDTLDQVMLYDTIKQVIPSYGMAHLARNRQRVEYVVAVGLPAQPQFLVRVKAFNAEQALLCLYENRNGDVGLPVRPATFFRLDQFRPMVMFLETELVSINTQTA